MKILVVDDHEENRYLLETLLTGNGYEVAASDNGQDALERLAEGGIDLIVSDILMPVMDGFQLCRRVKADEASRGIPFIFYTATYTGPQDEKLAFKIGADRFLVKPCEPDAFMAAVADVMAAAGRRGAGLSPEPVPEPEVLKLYSERLVRKLEQKMAQLEAEIEAHRETENALHKSQSRLIEAQRIARMGDFTWDLETEEISWSEPLYELLGYDKDEMFDYAKVNARIHHPADLERITRWLKDSIAAGKERLAPHEYRVLRGDGEVLFVRTAGVIHSRDKKKPLIFATVQDITDRKRAEMALRRSEKLLNQAQEIARIGSYVWNIADDALEWSRPMFAIAGLSPDDFYDNLSATMTNLIHPEDRDGVIEQLGQMVAQKRTWSMEFRLVRPDGGIRWLRSASRFEYDHSGEPVVCIGVHHDITEMRRIEAEQKKLQDQLLQAQKMEAIGRLAGGVAHDYNNMLNVIIGFTELAVEKAVPEDPLYEDLTEVLHAARRSAEITRQLLAFARQQTVDPRVLDLNETVEAMLKMLHRFIGEDIDLSWRPGPGRMTVLMDPSQIDQMLANLCVNARDAIGGVGRITIETGRVRFDAEYCADHAGFVPGDFILLAVSDDGTGMERETLDKLFEPFFTTKGVGAGTGLGLSTVFGIVKQNDGFINVYSEPGGGTTFNIYLPMHAGKETHSRAEDMTEIPVGQGETVLIVEDEASVLKLARRILERLGYTVLTAATPGQAMIMAKEHTSRIDLLITDVVMPEMNGRELAEKLQAVFPNLKILFMSGYTANVIAHRGVLDEGVIFVQKPFSKRDLAVKVRAAVDTL